MDIDIVHSSDKDEGQDSDYNKDQDMSTDAYEDNESDDQQAPSTDLPPELLLQSAFTGRSAQILSSIEDNPSPAESKVKNLHVVSHDGWSKRATVKMEDIPIWFEWEVSGGNFLQEHVRILMDSIRNKIGTSMRLK